MDADVRKSWGTDSPRWDGALREGDATSGLASARAQARSMRTRVDGFENSLNAHTPMNRAKIRATYSPWYYDLHRSERLASAPDKSISRAYAYHLKTRDLAESIARTQPGSLEAAFTSLQEMPGVSRDDVAREYMLWRHSLHPIALDEVGIETPASIFSERRQPGDLINLDETLRDVFGDLTRSPEAARIAHANIPEHSFVRGATDEDGHMIVGVNPATHAKALQESRKVPVEQMAHSILARHGAREREAFAKHVGGDEPEHHMAMAMAHGVFDHPTISTTADEAPSDYAVHYTGRAFGRKPKHDPGLFRAHA